MMHAAIRGVVEDLGVKLTVVHVGRTRGTFEGICMQG
jgi:hypothetical protein